MPFLERSQTKVVRMDRLVGNPERVGNELFSGLQLQGGIALGESVSFQNLSLELPSILAGVVHNPLGYQLLKVGTRLGHAVLPNREHDSLRQALGRSMLAILAEGYTRVYAWSQDDIEQFQRLNGLNVVDTLADRSPATGSRGAA